MRIESAAIRKRFRDVVGIPGMPVLMLINIVFGMSISFVMPYNSMFGIDEVGMTTLQFGLFMTVSSIIGILISTAIARFSDTVLTRRKVLLMAIASGMTGYLGYAFLRNYYVLLFIASFILGIASTGFPQIFAYARETVKRAKVPSKEVPYVMNIFRMMFALAWTVGPAFASVILVNTGFRGLFLSVTLGYAVTLLIVFFYLKEDTEAPARTSSPIRLSELIRKPKIMVNLAAFILVFASGTISFMNMSQFVIKELGGTEGHVGIIFSVPPVFELPFMYWFGVLATRIDNAKLIRIGVFLSAVYFICIVTVTEPWQIYPVQLLSAAYVSITSGIAITYFQDFIPEEPGMATTLYSNAQRIGSMLGFVLFGLSAYLLEFRYTYLVCAVSCALAFLLLAFFDRSRKVESAKSPINECG